MPTISTRTASLTASARQRCRESFLTAGGGLGYFCLPLRLRCFGVASAL